MIMNKVGRKLAILALSLPVTAAWILILCTRSVVWLYVARIVSGFTLGGVSFVVPIYIAEIVEPSARGPLSSIFQVRANFRSFVKLDLSSERADPSVTVLARPAAK
jgi:SP family facilitated glucose transporter-like MFS transporter 8